ncbi:hypothetical protein [Granulicella sp. L60]|uniref:hypothetical protein n=1 Tax=Granulicella sp. L60 TaxID=1641866 RepID=UPI00131B50C3|nr:hypothetical protein [Granulicella sp. L60]
MWSAVALAAGDGRGIEMMSAAILLTGNTEQAGVRTSSSERGGSEIASFAQSFDENVSNSTGIAGGGIHDGEAVEHRGVQGDATKTVGETTPAGEGKIKAVVDEGAVGEGGKTETTRKNVVQVSDFKVESQNGSLMKGVEVTGHDGPEVESTAEMAEVSQHGEPKAPVDGDPAGTAPTPTTDSSTQKQTLISKNEEVVVVQKKEGAAPAKADETGPVKKTGKTKESSATKAGHKATETGLKTSGGETKLSAQPSVQAPAPAISPAPAVNGAPASVVAKAPESGRDDGVSAASKPVQLSAGSGEASIQTPSASSSGSDTQGGGSNVVANEMGAPAAAMPDGQAEASKLNATQPSTTLGVETDGKAQTAVAAAMHAMGAGGGTSSEFGTTMLSPAGVPADASFAKLPIGGAAAHGTNPGTMSAGSDGSSAVTAGSMDGAPKTFEATPTALEIGVQNGTHGWLKVRAEMTDSGVVNASVSTATAAGQEMLHRELPALTAYLHQEKVAVNMVVVNTPTTAGGEFRGSVPRNGDAGDGQAASAGGQQQGFGRAASGRAGETTGQRSWDGDGEDGLPSNATYAEGGSWLSVRA